MTTTMAAPERTCATSSPAVFTVAGGSRRIRTVVPTSDGVNVTSSMSACMIVKPRPRSGSATPTRGVPGSVTSTSTLSSSRRATTPTTADSSELAVLDHVGDGFVDRDREVVGDRGLDERLVEPDADTRAAVAAVEPRAHLLGELVGHRVQVRHEQRDVVALHSGRGEVAQQRLRGRVDVVGAVAREHLGEPVEPDFEPLVRGAR